MSNIRNSGSVIGNLANNPVVFVNNDGSRTVKLDVYARNNYTNRDGERGSAVIPLRAFLPATKADNGVFSLIGKGDQVAVAYSVRNNNYRDKSGEMVYGIELFVESVDMLESKAVTEARRARHAAEAAQTPVAQPQHQAPVAQMAPAPQYQTQAPAPAQQYQAPAPQYQVPTQTPAAQMAPAPAAQPQAQQYQAPAQAPSGDLNMANIMQRAAAVAPQTQESAQQMTQPM